MRAAALTLLLVCLASQAGARTERLRWTQPAGTVTVSQFRVYWGITPSSYTNALGVGIPAKEATGDYFYDLVVPDANMIYVTVTAWNGALESARSNEISRAGITVPPPPQPPPDGLPGIPGSPIFTSIASSTSTVNVQVSWAAATNAASYHYSSGVNTGTWAGTTGTTTTRTATLPAVPRGARVWACVVAMNTAGAQSAQSCNGYDVPLATTPQLLPLPAPTGGAIDPQTYRVAPVPNATGYVWTANGGAFATTTTPSVLILWAAGPPSIPVTIAVRGVRSTDPTGTPVYPTYVFQPNCFNVAGCTP